MSRQRTRILLVVLIMITAYWFFSSARPTMPDVSRFISNLKYTHKSRTSVLNYNPESHILAAGYESGRVEFHDATQIGVSRIIKAHNVRGNHVVTSNDGSIALTSSHFEDETKMWDLKTGSLRKSIPNTWGPDLITPDGGTFFLASYGDIRIYDNISGEFYPGVFSCDHPIESLALSHAEQYLTVGTACDIQLWRILLHSNDELTLEQVSVVAPYGPADWIENIQFTESDEEIVTVSRFGGLDRWLVPLLDARQTYPTAIKHVSSSIITGPDLNDVVTFGTEERHGLGKGYAEISHLKNETHQVALRKLTNSPMGVLFPSANKILIANRRRYITLDFEK